MKLKPNFMTHETKGEHYLVATGDSVFHGIVKNNETAALILDCLQTDTTQAALVDKLLATYSGVDRETVSRDVMRIVDMLRTIGAIEE